MCVQLITASLATFALLLVLQTACSCELWARAWWGFVWQRNVNANDVIGWVCSVLLEPFGGERVRLLDNRIILIFAGSHCVDRVLSVWIYLPVSEELKLVADMCTTQPCICCVQGSFCAVKAGWSVEVVINIYLVPGLRMCWTVLRVPRTSSWPGIMVILIH
jgi:hypothetical protein